MFSYEISIIVSNSDMQERMKNYEILYHCNSSTRYGKILAVL